MPYVQNVGVGSRDTTGNSTCFVALRLLYYGIETQRPTTLAYIASA
jgi:hypothetical protein